MAGLALARGTAWAIIVALLIGGLGGAGWAPSWAGESPSPPTSPSSSPSYIGAEEMVSPTLIYYKGSGVAPERATVTLTLRALRSERFPLDLVLVVDRSATSDLAAIREIGRKILGRLGREDRVALVSFAGEATVDVGLTYDKGAVLDALAALVNEGKTAFGEGLARATGLLLEEGREEAIWAEVALVDGRSNVGRDPLPQAWSAAGSGIKIFTIGVGRYPLEAILAEVAEATGGKFYKGFSPEVLQDLFANLHQDVIGSEVVITQVLSPGFNYEGALVNPPTEVTSSEGLTLLEWSIEELKVGESWSTKIEISCSTVVERPVVLAIEERPTGISFLDFRGRRVELELPPQTITVRGPNRPPQADFAWEPSEPTTQDVVRFVDLSRDPDGVITSWAWDFGDGTTSTERNPTHRYADDGLYTVRLTVKDNEGATGTKAVKIQVANVPPVAMLTVVPEQPGIGQLAVFDASGSHDPDGEIISYEWDLDGDGTYELRTEEPKVEKAFDRSGTYLVALRVTDDDGATSQVSKELKVVEPVVVTRTINTFLHVDKTLPGQTFQVAVKIEVKMPINGLGLDENLPEGFKLKLVENAGGTYHEREAQWLFLEKLSPGTTKTVIYEVTVPPDAELGVYTIRGTISSASPRFELPVLGESEVELTDRLPISWVISRWDTQKDQFDIRLGDLITFEQIQLAVAWWLQGKVVPYTGGKVIDLQTIEELVAYWLTDTPVYEPLP